jgi:hypothetical protein
MRVPNDFNFDTEALEADEELEAVAWAENNGWEARKMTYVGRRGCPDRFFFGYGVIIPAEFKRLVKGRKSAFTAGQPEEHKRLARVGVTVHVFYTAHSAIELLKTYM